MNSINSSKELLDFIFRKIQREYRSINNFCTEHDIPDNTLYKIRERGTTTLETLIILCNALNIRIIFDTRNKYTKLPED